MKKSFEIKRCKGIYIKLWEYYWEYDLSFWSFNRVFHFIEKLNNYEIFDRYLFRYINTDEIFRRFLRFYENIVFATKASHEIIYEYLFYYINIAKSKIRCDNIIKVIFYTNVFRFIETSISIYKIFDNYLIYWFFWRKEIFSKFNFHSIDFVILNFYSLLINRLI